MKKITNVLIVCSLTLAGAVMAQEPTPDQSQKEKKQPPKHQQTTAVKPAPTRAPKSQGPTTKQSTTTQAPAMTPAPKHEKKSPKKNTNSNDQSATNPTTTATPAVTKNQFRNKNSKATASPSMTPAAKTTATAKPETAKTTASPAPTTATTPAIRTTATVTPAAGATMTPAATAATSAAPSVSPRASTNAAAAKKPDPQKVQQIKQQHTSFRAQAKPQNVPAATYSQGYRLPGSEHWQGPQYEVYRSYHPERHDQGWYHQHYQRVELIAGGYYFFNAGYWYPAWGYSPSQEYYAYDAPIYVGKRAVPPDQVIADVQTELQDMGYYKGEVDGLLGPLTREALTAYQTDNGMTVTAVIDEPTLNSLDLS
jgi:hypothetical protein